MYKTKELIEIVYLSYKNIKVKQTIIDNSSVYFEFEDDENKIEELVNELHLGNSLVEPKFFMYKMNEIKKFLHDKVKRNN